MTPEKPATPRPSRPERRHPDELVADLEGRVGRVFADRAIALASLTHKSFCNEVRSKGETCTDNQRLEFLGDAVIDLSIGQRLMERLPQASEGELTRMRAVLVNEVGLAEVARTLGLGSLLRLGVGEDQNGGRDKASVLADAMEAVIGALYVDGGLPAVLACVDRIFGPYLDKVAAGLAHRDFKSQLQVEAMGRLKQETRYRIVAATGPEHEKTFEVEVVIGTTTWARATGRSKKEAEQAAARATLELWAQGQPPPGSPAQGV